MARLEHPGVVSVYDAGVHEGRAFLVMAYAGSQTLQDQLPLEPGDAAGRDELLRLFEEIESRLYRYPTIDPATFEAINASLAKMIADGRVDEIVARYLE